MKFKINLNKKSSFVITLFTMVILCFQSCTKAILEDVTPIVPIVETVKYDPDVATIMTNNCIACHSGPAANAGLDLTSYLNVRVATAQGNLIQRMNDSGNPMPPSGVLPAATRQVIDQWVTDGYLED